MATLIETTELGAREMTRLERWSSCVRRTWTRLSRRFIPRLVWYGQEIDVRVTFSKDRLTVDDSQGAFRQLFSGGLYEIEQRLRHMGIEFDAGMGCAGRDWEWDWSLSGPVSVTFKARARNPEKRTSKPSPPKLTLVA